MCKSKPSFFRLLTTTVLFLVITNSANAAWRVNWELGAFAEYSDNIRRANINKEDSTVLEPRGQINAVHEGPNFDAELAAANGYRVPLDSGTGTSNNFDLDGLLNWKIKPGLFEWSFEDHFSSEFPIDIRTQPDQSNKQDVNSFATGPLFTPRIFNKTNLIFEGRYIRTDAEKTDIDNNRLQGRVGVQRDLTPHSNVSINYLRENTDFSNNNVDPLVGNIDFNRDNYYIEYQLERQSLNIIARAGYTKIERDDGPNKTSDGGNNLLSLNYLLNSTSSVDLTLYDEFTDTTSDSSAAGEFGFGGGFGGIGGSGSTGIVTNTPIGDVVTDVSGDTVDSQGLFAGYNKQFSRLDTAFKYFYRKDDHDLVDINDRKTTGGIIDFTLPVTSTTVFGLTSEYRITDFDIGDREDDDFLIELTGEYFARRNLSFISAIEYRDRDSTIDSADFDEFLVRIGITYTNF